MKKYLNAMTDDDFKSKPKKANNKSKKEEKPRFDEKGEYSARPSELSCSESYKAIWKASIGK